RTEEVSARDTGRAAGVQAHSFPGLAERHRTGGPGVQGLLPEGQGGTESGLPPLQGEGALRLVHLPPGGDYRGQAPGWGKACTPPRDWL
ncbi:hypothetical protein ABTQ09_19855, partial [Acinetobacter baumannii]